MHFASSLILALHSCGICNFSSVVFTCCRWPTVSRTPGFWIVSQFPEFCSSIVKFNYTTELLITSCNLIHEASLLWRLAFFFFFLRMSPCTVPSTICLASSKHVGIENPANLGSHSFKMWIAICTYIYTYYMYMHVYIIYIYGYTCLYVWRMSTKKYRAGETDWEGL